MLTQAVESYLELRRAMGFALQLVRATSAPKPRFNPPLEGIAQGGLLDQVGALAW